MGDQDNVSGLVAEAARTSPAVVAVTVAGAADTVVGSALTWLQLASAAQGLARWLAAAGVRRGDRVGLLVGNRAEFPVAYFGVLWAGAVAVPLNTGYTQAELRFQLEDCAARLLVTTDEHAAIAAALAAEVAGLEQVLVAGGAGWLAAVTGDALPGPVGGGEDLAVLLYTSGTSGRPKGAMLSHRALLANLDQIDRLRPAPVGPGDVVLVVVPLFHVYGLTAGLDLVARHGATVVLVERFDPVQTLATAAEHQVSAIVAAPPVYVAWAMLPDVAAALRGVRLALSGAAPLPVEPRQRLHALTGLDVQEGYGLTETAPVLTTTLASDRAKASSIGRPLPGLELRLLGENGEPVEDGDPGEITVRGPNLFSGYWPDGAGGPDEQGWFATGDVAYADGDGDLFIVDRLRELILVSGFNVYPREVEDALTSHPAVAEAAVVGVSHPYTGQSVKALVVLRPGTPASAEELIDHCARLLARFKCPTTVAFVAQLPHSATGKVSKGRLRAAGLADGAGAPAPGAPAPGAPASGAGVAAGPGNAPGAAGGAAIVDR